MGKSEEPLSRFREGFYAGGKRRMKLQGRSRGRGINMERKEGNKYYKEDPAAKTFIFQPGG